MSLRVAVATLGCKLNQFESDSLATQFRNAGHELVSFSEPADVYVVNTCTVTNRGDRKSRNLVNRAAARPGSIVVVTGCYAESAREELEARPDIHCVVPNAQKHAILSMVESLAQGEPVEPSTFPADRFRFEGPAQLVHTRGLVKVQDGCDSRCSFCIIPTVRGRGRSRPVEDVLNGVTGLVEQGHREVVLTGVNLGRYSYRGVDFAELVGRILELPLDFRMRISSLEPDRLDERFLRLFHHPALCNHLHLCLQSGSSRVLRAMRRGYTVDRFRGLARGLREVDPLFNLTTDVIVGFPGEEDEDFTQTCRLAEELEFGHIHTFPYSPRAGTPAALMPDQVPQRLAASRAQVVRDIAARTKRAYRQRLVGSVEEVLVERADEDGGRSGYGEHYVPVRFTAPDAPENSLQRVLVTGVSAAGDGELTGACRVSTSPNRQNAGE
jgi:threonylcarbamoyladenosine tRNA methylthiotransferase MtaB